MCDDTRPPRGGKDPPAVLRLVHPAPPPKPDTTPRTRSGRKVPYQSSLFSPEEESRIKAALKNARALFGTWRCLADAMRVPLGAIELALRGRNRVTGALAIRLSRALGIPLEALLRGLASVPKVCPHCGRGGAP